jgi:hypothetical protein
MELYPFRLIEESECPVMSKRITVLLLPYSLRELDQEIKDTIKIEYA